MIKYSRIDKIFINYKPLKLVQEHDLYVCLLTKFSEKKISKAVLIEITCGWMSVNISEKRDVVRRYFI